MTLATLRYHDPNCSGCPACREDYAAMLDETPAQAARRCAAATQTAMRAAAARTSRPVRVSDEPARTAGEWRDHFGQSLQGFGSLQFDRPADPYAGGARMAPRQPCPFDDPDYNPRGTPPDGYALAVERRKKENR